MLPKKKRQTEHRTATTTYPCYLPILGGSAGAGRAGLLVQRYNRGTINSNECQKNPPAQEIPVKSLARKEIIHNRHYYRLSTIDYGLIDYRLYLVMIPFSMPAMIETERLLLQRLKYEDAAEIFYAYASKPEATKYLSWATHQSIDDTRTFLRYAIESWQYGTDYSYSIRLKNRLLIGSIGVLHENGKIQLGYVLSPTHWNNGYTTEACTAVLSVLKTFKDLYRIGTFVDAENTTSIKILEKCGLVEEARLEKWFRFINQHNQPKDCILFRL